MRLERDGADLLAEEAARVVLGARAPLLDDDLTLRGDLLGIEEQVLHAIRLEIDQQIELVGRDVHVIRGDVLRRERVVLAAVLLDQTRELLGAMARRALEHQVLEEMGDAGRAAMLVTRADAVPHLEGHDGAARVLEQEDAQAVVERRGDDAIGGARRRRNEERDEQQKDNRDAHRPIIPPTACTAGVSSCLMRALVFFLLIAIPHTAFAQQPCSEPLTSLFERVSPSVVSIQVTKINKAKPQRRFETVVGSGYRVPAAG